MNGYYTVRRFDGKRDLNGKIPRFRIVCNNRTSGKTTSITHELINYYMETGRKFMLLYRNKYEISTAHASLLPGKKLWEKEHSVLLPEMSTKKQMEGLFTSIMFGDKEAGFAFYLDSKDKLKRYSEFFSEVDLGFFDEFQLEKGNYLKDEPESLESILTTVARGFGERVRDVTVYLAGNNVSFVNPYYYHFRIFERLEPGAKFIRGNGWVLDCEKNEDASEAIENSDTFSAFSGSKYNDYSTGKTTLLNNDTFITNKITGKSRYICTVIYDGTYYGLRQYYESGILYLSKKYDKSSKEVYAVKKNDMKANIMLSARSGMLYKMLDFGYKNGALFFDSIGAQNCAYEALAVSLYK